MKKFISIVILAALFSAANSQKESKEKTILGFGTDYYAIPETLNGKVKSVRETNYWAIEENGKFVKGEPMTWKDLDSVNSTKNFTVYFDENGVLKQIDHFDVNNVIHDTNKGISENGKYPTWNYKSEGRDDSHYHISYDNLGYINTAEHHSMKDSLLDKQVLKNDGKGNYTRYEYWDPKGKMIYYQVFTVDDKGKVVNTNVYNGKDSLVFKGATEYDQEGRFINARSCARCRGCSARTACTPRRRATACAPR